MALVKTQESESSQYIYDSGWVEVVGSGVEHIGNMYTNDTGKHLMFTVERVCITDSISSANWYPRVRDVNDSHLYSLNTIQNILYPMSSSPQQVIVGFAAAKGVYTWCASSGTTMIWSNLIPEASVSYLAGSSMLSGQKLQYRIRVKEAELFDYIKSPIGG